MVEEVDSVGIHEMQAEFDRLDAVIESLESMSRYLGIANGAVAFSLVSFVGSLLGGGIALDTSVKWMTIASLLSAFLAAMTGLSAIQGFTSERCEYAAAKFLYANNRGASSRAIFRHPDGLKRRDRIKIPFYLTCSFTALAAVLALNALARVVLI